MKKIKLANLELDAESLLSTDEKKQLTGGSGYCCCDMDEYGCLWSTTCIPRSCG